MNLRYFKPPYLQPFVTAAIGKTYNSLDIPFLLSASWPCFPSLPQPHHAQTGDLKAALAVPSPSRASPTSGLLCPHRLVLLTFFPCLPLLVTLSRLCISPHI